MRVCLVYDCLYPHTVGGAERWYRNLAERLVGEGHEVTYVTLRQWRRGRARADRRARAGRERRPAHGAVHDRRAAAHAAAARVRQRACSCTCCATAGATTWCTRARSRTSRCSQPPPRARWQGSSCVVDWFEVWSRAYWREYLGAAGGRGRRARRSACARWFPSAPSASRELHAERLREEGLRGPVTVLRGLYWPGGAVRPRRHERPSPWCCSPGG